jgi:hypothetical protein
MKVVQKQITNKGQTFLLNKLNSGVSRQVSIYCLQFCTQIAFRRYQPTLQTIGMIRMYKEKQ